MNHKKALASLLLCFILFNAFGQKDYFIIKDTKRNKVRKFKERNSFLFTTKTDSFFVKGKILEVKDTSLVLYLPEEAVPEEVEIPLSQFTIIRKPTKLQYVGYAIGTLFMFNGAYLLLEGPDVTNSEVANRGLGAVSFAIGLIPFLVTPKTYNLDGRYTIETQIAEKEKGEE